jgi:hypothetical protein
MRHGREGRCAIIGRVFHLLDLNQGSHGETW